MDQFFFINRGYHDLRGLFPKNQFKTSIFSFGLSDWVWDWVWIDAEKVL